MKNWLTDQKTLDILEGTYKELVQDGNRAAAALFLGYLETNYPLLYKKISI